MADLQVADLDTAQSDHQPTPPTIASAATIAPNHFMTFITGTVAIATITPPASGMQMLMFIFTTTTPVAFTTTGNIKAVATPTTNVPVLATWNPTENKWYIGVLKAT